MKQKQYDGFSIPNYSDQKGVGGWLALFIFGQLILRPWMTVSQLFNPENAKIARIAELFPTTGTLITVEKILFIHLLIFGIAVGVALWKAHNPFSVKLAKIYLLAYPVVSILNALLFRLSDLPPTYRDKVMENVIRHIGVSTVWCLIWVLYFTRSQRVKVTYFSESSTPPKNEKSYQTASASSVG